MSLPGGKGAGLQIAGGANLQRDLLFGQLSHKSRVFYAANAVPNALGTHGQRRTNAFGAVGLACVNGKRYACARKQGRVIIGGKKRLGPCQIGRAHASAQVFLGKAQCFGILRFGGTAHAAQDQLCFDGKALAAFGQRTAGGLHYLLLHKALLAVLAGGKAQLGI